MSEQAISQKAEQLFRSGIANDPLLQRQGRIEPPITIAAPTGAPTGWFVGVTVADQLAGFLQFTQQQQFLRYSTFQRQAGSLTGCPQAADWLDPATIQRHAQEHAEPDETLDTPVLTYDQHPTRLVWAVKTQQADGRSSMLYVTGTFVYR